MRKIITSILIVLLAATMCSAQIETSPRIMSSRTEIARQIHDSLATHEFLGDAGSIAYQDWWMLRQAGYTINTWDSVTTTAVWSEPFRAYDYMSVIVNVIKDSVRGYWEYWSGIDTTRATMVFGRTLEWDKAADLDSTYTSSTGYWNCNITSEAIPIHYYGRLKYVPGASGGRKIKDDSLLVVYITGRR